MFTIIVKLVGTICIYIWEEMYAEHFTLFVLFLWGEFSSQTFLEVCHTGLAI